LHEVLWLPDQIEAWLPPELAAQVEAIAEKARADYAGAESGSPRPVA